MNLDPKFYSSVPAIVQAAKDWRYYENAIIHHETVVGPALYAEYQQGGSWKAHYKTWEDACVPLGKSRRQIDRLIRSERDIRTQCPVVMQEDAEVSKVNALPPLGITDEELLGVPATVHAGPAPMAEKTGLEHARRFGSKWIPHGTVTAEKAPDVPRDLIGFPIPSVLLERWGQRQEVQDRITAASRLRCALEEIANKGHQNPLYGLYDWQGMIRTISQLQFHLGQCKPEVVCYECDGHFSKLKPTKGGGGITRHCHACDDRGFMVQKQWDDYADTKLAVIKEKVEARLAKCKKNGG